MDQRSSVKTILIIVTIFMIGTVGYFVFVKKLELGVSQPNKEISTTNWKVYKNESITFPYNGDEVGIEFKYPSELIASFHLPKQDANYFWAYLPKNDSYKKQISIKILDVGKGTTVEGITLEKYISSQFIPAELADNKPRLVKMGENSWTLIETIGPRGGVMGYFGKDFYYFLLLPNEKIVSVGATGQDFEISRIGNVLKTPNNLAELEAIVSSVHFLK